MNLVNLTLTNHGPVHMTNIMYAVHAQIIVLPLQLLSSLLAVHALEELTHEILH